jgi:hypothetical protein
MVDSGDRINNGSQDFEAVYRRLIDSSLRRPPTAGMSVTGERTGNLLELVVRLTNQSGHDLSAVNDAALTVLVWEAPSDPDVIPVIAEAATTPIASLADGATGEFALEVTVDDLDAARTRWVVIADYMPVGDGYPYDTLQAVAGP